MDVSVLLVVIGMIFFVLAALPIPTGPLSLGWLGMAFFAASFLFR